MCFGFCKKKEENKRGGPRRSRKSIFSETWDPSEDDGERIVIEKTNSEKEWLKKTLKGIVIFTGLDDDQLREVVEAMGSMDVDKGQTIITIGDEDEAAMELYVVERGTFYAIIVNNGQEKVVNKYQNNGYFGELALMYNQPRSATVRAETDGKLWKLDRKTFRRIVLRKAYDKRKTYENFIKSVPLLEALEPQELLNVVDVLLPRTYNDKEKIITQDEKADGMYFVEEGKVNVFVTKNGAQKQISTIEVGGYFGELALLTKNKRAATVIADGPVKVAFLDAGAFERLLGPCKTIMQRNAKDYQKKLDQAFGGT